MKLLFWEKIFITKYDWVSKICIEIFILIIFREILEYFWWINYFPFKFKKWWRKNLLATVRIKFLEYEFLFKRWFLYLENRPLRNCPLRFCFIFIFFHHSDMFIHWRLIYRVFQKEDCKLLISTFFTTLSIKARIFVAIYFLWQRLNIFFSPVLLWTAPISNMEFLSRLFRSNIKFDGIIDLKNV